ncbi:hypothetical protein [Cellvibrio sp. QJXJ]|uniref:hypothetical protein n=1 Tax=Cellvibrio sp. QJXJ TaxID=2964606 RepID=UPI0021C43BD5|nr:hypothetical protein [Cellvibrio sp. QJXJ]UUA72205.1 hypothetical protein NNX04_17535 [Cellvibrio sp. QJXJ]
MSQLSDLDENIKNLVGKIDRYFKWTADSAWKRMFTLIAFGGLILFAQAIYLNHLITEMDKDSIQYAEENRLLESEIRYGLAIDWLDTCLKNASLKSENSIWYCQYAIEHYRNTTETNNEHKEKLIKNIAYEAMLIDLKNNKRRIEADRLRLKYKSPEYELLTLLVSKTVSTLFIALCILSILGLSFAMYKYRKKHQRDA